MSINVGGGANIVPNPTPYIFEQETTGSTSLRNQGQMGFGVPIQPNTDQLTLANLIDRNIFQGYRSDQPRPPAPPAGSLRTSGAKADQGGTLGWEDNYNELASDLPPELTNVLAEPEFKAVLSVAANVLSGLDKTDRMDVREEALNNANQNISLPERALGGFLTYGGEFIKEAASILDQKGANDPEYLAQKESLQQFENLFNRFKPT